MKLQILLTNVHEIVIIIRPFSVVFRRMCPAISLAFKDLNPRQMYAVMIDFAYADEFRYFFDMSTNRWAPWRPIKQEDDFPRMYLHPETPTTGDLLMKRVLTFKRLKLTNSSQTASKTIQVSCDSS